MRGGEPHVKDLYKRLDLSSPHTRGVSQWEGYLPRMRGGESPRVTEKERRKEGIFPAYAGVSLCPSGAAIAASNLPRMRGGEPTLRWFFGQKDGFSPHTRG